MKPITTFQAHDNYVLCLHFSADSNTLISTGMDGQINFWSVPEWSHIKTLTEHEKSVNGVALSPNQQILATGSTDNTVRLWSFPDGKPLHTLQDRKQVVAAVTISPDGAWVAAASYSGRVAVWTLDGEEVVAFKANPKNLGSLIFTPDCKTLITGGLGDDIQVWSMPSGEQIGTLSGHQIAVGSLRVINQGKTLISMGYEGMLRFWDTATWTETRQLDLRGKGVRGLAISPDERTLAVSMESKIELWNVGDLAFQKEIAVDARALYGMAFSPAGRWLAVGAADKKIRVWDMS